MGCGAPVDGFVDLHDAAATTHWIKRARTHRLPNPVRHEPSRLEGDPHHAVQLVAGDALLGGAQQGNGLQPHPHRDMAVLENGPDLHGGGVAAVPALVETYPGGLALERGDAVEPDLSTARAHGTVRPQMSLHPLVCLRLIPEAFV